MDDPAPGVPANLPPTSPRARVEREFLCVSCGYSIRGRAFDEFCPECGTPVLHSVGRSPPPAGTATASFVLGILSIAGVMTMGALSLVCAPAAIAFACITLRRVKRREVSDSSRGLAIAGLVTGIIGALVLLAFAAYFVVIYLRFASGSPTP